MNKVNIQPYNQLINKANLVSLQNQRKRNPVETSNALNIKNCHGNIPYGKIVSNVNYDPQILSNETKRNPVEVANIEKMIKVSKYIQLDSEKNNNVNYRINAII